MTEALDDTLKRIATEIVKRALVLHPDSKEREVEIARAHGVLLALQAVDENTYATIELDKAIRRAHEA